MGTLVVLAQEVQAHHVIIMESVTLVTVALVYVIAQLVMLVLLVSIQMQ